jgi:hypothetical protein
MARKVTAGHMALRSSEHPSPSPEPTHHVVAVSPEGHTLWVTESYYPNEPEAPQVKFADDYSGIVNEVIDGQMVARFELREA